MLPLNTSTSVRPTFFVSEKMKESATRVVKIPSKMDSKRGGLSSFQCEMRRSVMLGNMSAPEASTK
jgi:hypothetical protein